MSQESMDAVRRVYDAVHRHDTETVLALYDESIEWDATRAAWSGLDETGEVHRGHEGLRRWFRKWGEVWEERRDDFELIEAGEHDVVSVVSSRGRGRASGIEIETHHAAVWTVRDGKIVRVVWFKTAEEALEAAGLSK